MNMERREQLRGISRGESGITMYLANQHGSSATFLSRKKSSIVPLSHLCLGFFMILLGLRLPRGFQVASIVLGFIIALPFAEKAAWLFIKYFKENIQT